MKLLLLTPLFARSSVRITSKGESTPCPIRKHFPLILCMGSSAHLFVPHICTIIPLPRRFSTVSSARLSVAHLWCWCPISCHNSQFSFPWRPPPPIDSCRIPIASDPVYLQKSLLAYPSVEHPPLSAATTRPVSTPCPRTQSTARRLRIWSGGTPTMPPLLGACLCMSVRSDSRPPSECS